MKISFSISRHSPIELPAGANLSEFLTVQNSPVLFGCRTGICGTCLCEVKGDVAAATDDERELLEILAPDNSKARLACQLRASSDIELKYLGLT